MPRKQYPSAPFSSPRHERRHPALRRDGPSDRAAVARYLSKHRLEDLLQMLQTLAVGIFGPEATVVPHLRRALDGPRLTFVVDAADPTATVRYADFMPREQTFWSAYAALDKPGVPYAVAIRPARGWSRTEALAPLFTALPFPSRIS